MKKPHSPLRPLPLPLPPRSRSFRAALAALPLALLAFSAPAAKTYQTTIDGVEVKLTIPDGLKTVRAMVVNAADLSEADRVFAGWPGTANMGLNLLDDKRNQRPTIINNAFTKACQVLGDSSGHPELVNVPILAYGMSRGAGWSAVLAQRAPWRALAYGMAAGWVPDTTMSDTALKIPAMVTFGDQQDGYNMYPKSVYSFQFGRSRGAQWTLGIMWGVGHQFSTSGILIYPLFQQMLEARLPADADPSKGRVKLRDLPRSEHWFGDMNTWETAWPVIARASDYRGDTTKAVWLPNEYMARLWRSFAAKQKSMAVISDLGSGSPKHPLSASTPIAVSLLKPDSGLAKMSYYDGNILLAEVTASPWHMPPRPFAMGVRTIVAEATMKDGSMRAVKPTFIWVGPGAGTGLRSPGTGRKSRGRDGSSKSHFDLKRSGTVLFRHGEEGRPPERARTLKGRAVPQDEASPQGR